MYTWHQVSLNINVQNKHIPDLLYPEKYPQWAEHQPAMQSTHLSK